MAVWTEINFFPLLTRPQGSQGYRKMRHSFTELEFGGWVAKIEPKFNNLQKNVKMKKNHQNIIFSYDFSYGVLFITALEMVSPES